MYKKLFSCLFALLISLPISAEETSAVESVTPSKKDETLIQDAIKLTLKDPESAKFRNLVIMESTGKKGACIEINAKNGFGGYAGFKTSMLVVLKNKWKSWGVNDDSMELCKYLLESVLQSDEWKSQ